MSFTITSSGNTSTSTSVTINVPSGLSNGDLMIATIGAISDATTTLSTPSGWTLVQADYQNSNRYVMATYSRVCSSEPSSYNFTMTAGANPIMRGAITGIVGGRIVTEYSTRYIVQNDLYIYGNAVTPSYANSLILFTTHQITGGTVASYSIATDNPTWTEINDNGVSVAYAIRPQTTSTGEPIAIMNSTSTTKFCQMIVIKEMPSFTISETVSTTESKLNDISSNSNDIISLTENYTEDISRVWNKTSKPTTTWINRPKN